jgi:CubicO group peptidase (beta-lactamase class C family)
MFTPGAIAAALGVPSPPVAADIVKYMGTQAMQFAPGTNRAYSNVGYATLGRIIARATGMSYSDHVRGALFDPIGATTFAPARTFEDQRAPDEVSYYHGGAENVLVNSVFADRPGQVRMAYGGFHVEALDATGGWLAAAPDVARFLLAVDGRNDHPDLITPASRALLGVDPGLPGNLANYGMGWFRIGPTMFGTGRLPGQASLVVIDEQRELTWTLLLNWSLGTVDFSNEYANVLTQVITNHATWPATDLFGQY